MDARSLKDQLSDQLPPEQADNAAEAASALKETSAGYFEDCKSVASMLNSHLQQASDKVGCFWFALLFDYPFDCFGDAVGHGNVPRHFQEC